LRVSRGVGSLRSGVWHAPATVAVVFPCQTLGERVRTGEDGGSFLVMSNRPATIGQLRESGWESVPVKAEIRRNAVARIRAGEPLVDAVLGYEDTVLPQLENAILAGHDVIFLGERGQAKTRMIRSLTDLLDEWMPIVAGSEINDDPYAPVSHHARELIAEKGEDTPIDWVHRDTRYGEKLATPDTSIADLIGEVDPIKVAEGRYLSDELTLHYGLVPRTNRGIFAINELPDLAERIQVGLLNVLEERDVQIRGFKVRLPLDVVLFASANPEDYTNRGRLITPLKDRFGAQIRTHYPLDVETEMAIASQEARPLDDAGLDVAIPDFMAEVVSTLSQLARQSSHINQRSGVSVRLTVTNLETLVANAARRALRAGDASVVPRISDLEALAASTSGKVELDTLDDDGGEVIERLVRQAVLTVFRERLDVTELRGVIDAFDDGRVIHAGEDVAAVDEAKLATEVPALRDAVVALVGDDERPAVVASAVEFVLEGLHLSKRLNKDVDHIGTRATYHAR
jgi:magnesium chelatase subunit I